MSDQFFSWASRKDIHVRNRRILYEFIDKFKTALKNGCRSDDIQENGEHESSSEPEGKCNDNINEASLSNCDSTSMDIDANNDCKVIVKEKRKGGKRKQNVEDDVRVSDMDVSSVDELVKNKKSGKEEISQVCEDFEMEMNKKISSDNNDTVNDNYEKQCGNKCSTANESGALVEGKKREGVLQSRSEEKAGMFNVEPKSKRKRGKPDEKKPCEKVHENSKPGKKKRKSNQKCVVFQSTNGKELVKNEDNEEGELSLGSVGKDWLEIMDNTSDPLDGSYLSTLPRLARNVTLGNVAKTEVFKSGPKVQNTYDAKSDVKNTRGTDLSANTVAANGNTMDNTSDETTETRENKAVNLSPDSMPLAMFLRHSQKKVKVTTGPKTKKERKEKVG